MRIDTAKLERARIIRGLSKSALAKQVELNPSTIRRVERGEHMTPKTVKKIADELGLTMEELVLESDTAA